MAMAQVVPMFDWFRDWYAPVQTQYAMAKAFPDRVLFCGGVDPKYRGPQDALAPWSSLQPLCSTASNDAL